MQRITALGAFDLHDPDTRLALQLQLRALGLPRRWSGGAEKSGPWSCAGGDGVLCGGRWCSGRVGVSGKVPLLSHRGFDAVMATTNRPETPTGTHDELAGVEHTSNHWLSPVARKVL
ncbi:hypothetical protein, partial [Ornithinimicrobium sediminis]|uniref:hypothetical protein n=1 Tax=Ornithinimicrobium sediminis TaxID=2904603 RepID=UPI001E5F5041